MTRFEPHLEKSQRDRAQPPLTCRFRTAVAADADALGAIEAHREGGKPAVHAEKMRRSIAEPGLLLVAEHDGRVVGFGKARHFEPAPDAPANVAPRGWYLAGVIVAPEFRQRGVGRQLTEARLAWIAERADQAFYFANARNRVTIELHEPFGFVEVTRDFTFPGASFEGGEGILFRARLDPDGALPR